MLPQHNLSTLDSAVRRLETVTQLCTKYLEIQFAFNNLLFPAQHLASDA